MLQIILNLFFNLKTNSTALCGPIKISNRLKIKMKLNTKTTMQLRLKSTPFIHLIHRSSVERMYVCFTWPLLTFIIYILSNRMHQLMQK